ncbi:MAG: hypothetical protein CMH70_02660 [Nitrosomonadaceae bacterium]|nr:hypothetical protein [Nitrosomonadaceae bacterium]|tara:strand:- start:383 stop:658 length:276 start_codon:yes stop_codon:yes gene_type:complete
MKKLFLLPILLLSLISTSSLSETTGDLVERDDGIFYKIFTDVLFLGKVTGYQKGRMENRKQEGKRVTFYKNGQLREKGIYKNVVMEGEWGG